MHSEQPENNSNKHLFANMLVYAFVWFFSTIMLYSIDLSHVIQNGNVLINKP